MDAAARRHGAEAVAALDADGDGRVDEAELRAAIASGKMSASVFGAAGDAARTARHVVETFDTDGDGVLDSAELASMAQAAERQRRTGEKHGAEVVAALDRDGDGRVDEAELRAGIASGRMGNALGSADAAAQTARHIFETFDADGDGVLDVAEIGNLAAAAQQRQHKAAQIAAEVVAALDADGDGRVDEAELRAGIASGKMSTRAFGAAENAEQTARHIFSSFDADGDGLLDVGEIAALAQQALAPADARLTLMELVPLFDETKQFLRKVETNDRSAPQLCATNDDGTPLGSGDDGAVAPARGSFGFTALETRSARLEDMLARARHRHPRLQQEDHSWEAIQSRAEQLLAERKALQETGDGEAPEPRTPLSLRRRGLRQRWEEEQAWDPKDDGEEGLAEGIPPELRPRGLSLELGAPEGGGGGGGSPRSKELLRRARELRHRQGSATPGTGSAVRVDALLRTPEPALEPEHEPELDPRMQRLHEMAADRRTTLSPTRTRPGSSRSGSPQTPSSPTLERARSILRTSSGSATVGSSSSFICGQLRQSPQSIRGRQRSLAEVERVLSRARARR